MADISPPESNGKGGIEQNEVLHDHDVLGNSNITREDAMHYGELTAEERIHEKKLKRKIDTLIMPLVMLVYLMNYIDRNSAYTGPDYS